MRDEGGDGDGGYEPPDMSAFGPATLVGSSRSDHVTPDAEEQDFSETESRIKRRADERAHRSRRRKKVLLISASSLLGFVVLIAGAAAGYLWYENQRIHRVQVKHLSGVETSGAQKDVQNILLIGSTTRCGLKQQNPVFGLCSEGVNGVNSDVVMILHLDPDHNRAAILSIPRDTIVPNAREDGLNKIDAALGDPAGPSQLIAAITEDFGIPIQHYVELNFDSFQGVVQALGGLKMYFPMPLYDLESDLHVPNAGCIALNGFQALAVVRARHLQYQPASDAGVAHYAWPYDPQSDLSRIRRDHEFLRVMASAVAHRGLGNFVTDIQLINSLAGNLAVDNGFSASAMASLVLQFHGVDPNAVPQYTLPVVEDSQGYYYRGGGYGDVVFPVQPEDAQVVSEFLGNKPSTDASGKALPAPGTFTVAIENGSSVYDAGERTAKSLEALGYDVTSVTDTEQPASTTETSVLYATGAERDAALQVLSSLSGLGVIGYDPGIVSHGGSDGSGSSGSGSSGSGSSGRATSTTIDVGSPLSSADAAQVVVVLGSNFAVNPPATPASGSPVATSTSTTSTSASTTSPQGQTGSVNTAGPLADNPDLAAPSSSTETLEPWDPRSCTASGGPGP